MANCSAAGGKCKNSLLPGRLQCAYHTRLNAARGTDANGIDAKGWIRAKMREKYPNVTDNHTGTIIRKRMIQSHVEHGYVLEGTTWKQLLKHHGIKIKAQRPGGNTAMPTHAHGIIKNGKEVRFDNDQNNGATNDPEYRQALEVARMLIGGGPIIDPDVAIVLYEDFTGQDWPWDPAPGKKGRQTGRKRERYLAASMTQFDTTEELRQAVLNAKAESIGGGGRSNPREEDFNFYLTFASMVSDTIARAKAGATNYADESRPNSALSFTPYAEGLVTRKKMFPWETIAQRNAMEKAMRGKMFEFLKGKLSSEGLAREVFHFPNTPQRKALVKDAFIEACDYINSAMKVKKA